MIGRDGERGSRISALAARHDDDDDNNVQHKKQWINKDESPHPTPKGSGNLLSFLLRCGTRPYERGTQ